MNKMYSNLENCLINKYVTKDSALSRCCCQSNKHFEKADIAFVYTHERKSELTLSLPGCSSFQTYQECLSCKHLLKKLFDTSRFENKLIKCACFYPSGCVQRERGTPMSHSSCSVPALHLPVSVCWETLRYKITQMTL